MLALLISNQDWRFELGELSELRYAGANDVNREVELRPPSRVAPSDLPGSLLLVMFLDGYLLGSYHSATAPEPTSSRLTSFKSTCFDGPANNVGP